MTDTTPAQAPATEQTLNCDVGQHDFCDGYVAPLVYSSTRPCACRCHERDNPRDFQRGVASARESFYACTGSASSADLERVRQGLDEDARRARANLDDTAAAGFLRTAGGQFDEEPIGPNPAREA